MPLTVGSVRSIILERRSLYSAAYTCEEVIAGQSNLRQMSFTPIITLTQSGLSAMTSFCQRSCRSRVVLPLTPVLEIQYSRSGYTTFRMFSITRT